MGRNGVHAQRVDGRGWRTNGMLRQTAHAGARMDNAVPGTVSYFQLTVCFLCIRRISALEMPLHLFVIFKNNAYLSLFLPHSKSFLCMCAFSSRSRPSRITVLISTVRDFFQKSNFALACECWETQWINVLVLIMREMQTTCMIVFRTKVKQRKFLNEWCQRMGVTSKNVFALVKE